jgi:polysaccharide export outer membrane protein
MRLLQNTSCLCAFLLCFALTSPGEVQAEYKIGPEDVLQISFWQQPTLDQTVTVRRDGKITISIIGEITAAGLKPAELAKKIGERANYYNPAISQAAVTVLAFNSQKVYINGQVAQPGAYAFEELPDVWTLIKEAGGVAEMADLSKVTLIRGSKDAGRIITINIEKLVASGEFDDIPGLYPGDIVEVPRMPGGIAGSGLPSSGLPKADRERRNIIFVTGAVTRSGPINLEDGMDVLDALVMAGGTTVDADLSKVRVISKHQGYSSVMTIDLDKYSSEGTPRRYFLRAEDTIVLPRKTGGLFRVGWGTFRDLVAITATVVSTVVLVDQIGSR